MMKPDIENRIYRDVPFRFYSTAYVEPLNGSVLVRPAEMVLEINGTPLSEPYLVQGGLIDGYYTGENRLGHGCTPVEAAWALTGGRFVGFWVEDGEEYLFTFQLTKKEARPGRRIIRSGASEQSRELMQRMEAIEKRKAKQRAERPTESRKRPVPGGKTSPRSLTAGQRLLKRLEEAEKSGKPKRIVVRYVPR
jgi:hypothetical protein